MSDNYHPGCSHHPSTPCPINHLLSELYLAGSSSPLALRGLSLGRLEMTAECSGYALEKVLSLGSRGLHYVLLEYNPDMSSHARTLIRTISNDNFHIHSFHIDRLNNLECKAGEEQFTGRCEDTLTSALERNKRLEEVTHQAAVELLNLSRILIIGSPGPSSSPSSSSGLAEPAKRTHFLDLPSELLQLVLSFVSSGALSNQQVLFVIRNASDRTTLVPTTLSLETLLERKNLQGSVDLDARVALPFEKKDDFLFEMECDRYER